MGGRDYASGAGFGKWGSRPRKENGGLGGRRSNLQSVTFLVAIIVMVAIAIMLVTPLPVLALLARVQSRVLTVLVTALLRPLAVVLLFVRIPRVIIAAIRVVDPTLRIAVSLYPLCAII